MPKSSCFGSLIQIDTTLGADWLSLAWRYETEKRLCPKWLNCCYHFLVKRRRTDYPFVIQYSSLLVFQTTKTMSSNNCASQLKGLSFIKIETKVGSFTYYSHLYSIRVWMREVTEQEKGVIFCQASGIGKISQLIADVLHCCSLPQTRVVISNSRKRNRKRVPRLHQEKWYARRWLTGGTLSLLKTSVTEPQLLSKCPLLGWHFVDDCEGERPAMEQTPHSWQGGEKHVR